MAKKYYSGVGSRDTPLIIQAAETDIAHYLEQDGYTLRSGGAKGSDLAFEAGVIDPANKDIYLPEEGFNGSTSKLFTICDRAYAMALEIHPAPHIIKTRPRTWRFHARNCYQDLGKNLDEPSDFVLCWTPAAAKVGGTRTAIVLAEKHKIPVLNFGLYDTYKQCMKAFENFYTLYGS